MLGIDGSVGARMGERQEGWLVLAASGSRLLQTPTDLPTSKAAPLQTLGDLPLICVNSCPFALEFLSPPELPGINLRAASRIG